MRTLFGIKTAIEESYRIARGAASETAREFYDFGLKVWENARHRAVATGTAPITRTNETLEQLLITELAKFLASPHNSALVQSSLLSSKGESISHVAALDTCFASAISVIEADDWQSDSSHCMALSKALLTAFKQHLALNLINGSLHNRQGVDYTVYEALDLDFLNLSQHSATQYKAIMSSVRKQALAIHHSAQMAAFATNAVINRSAHQSDQATMGMLRKDFSRWLINPNHQSSILVALSAANGAYTAVVGKHERAKFLNNQLGLCLHAGQDPLCAVANIWYASAPNNGGWNSGSSTSSPSYNNRLMQHLFNRYLESRCIDLRNGNVPTANLRQVASVVICARHTGQINILTEAHNIAESLDFEVIRQKTNQPTMTHPPESPPPADIHARIDTEEGGAAAPNR